MSITKPNILTVPEAGKYTFKVPTNPVLGDGTLPGSLLTVNSPDGETKLWCLVLFYKGTNYIHESSRLLA